MNESEQDFYRTCKVVYSVILKIHVKKKKKLGLAVHTWSPHTSFKEKRQEDGRAHCPATIAYTVSSQPLRDPEE